MMITQEEWDIIVDVINEIVPDGEADCFGLPEELIDVLQRRLQRPLHALAEES